MNLKNFFGRPYRMRLFVLTALLGTLPLAVEAQTESSQYDRGTPPQHAAGVSALGSYISTDLGTINLTNGSLNFAIPLGQVGGRGFSVPITLNYSSKVWSGSTGTEVVLDPTYRTYPARIAVYDSPEGAPDIYQRVAPGWTLGAVPMLRVRGVGINTVNNISCGAEDYLKALTKLTLILPDKGEIELRDDYTDGSPLGALFMAGTNCRWMDGNRGQRWHATDGSGIVFISDTTNGVVNGDLNGWIITADGTRYRFADTVPSNGIGSVFLNEFARATSITDRNGNRIQIGYSANPLTVTFTDQLGRTSTIEYNVTDTGETLLVRVTVPGYGGQSRKYKLRGGVMNQNYRGGVNPALPVYNGYAVGMGGEEACRYAPSSRTDLFASWCGGAEQIDNRTVMTEVVLPDARSVKFRYNEYGEVAEVEMPTGGRVQYDYAYDPNDGLPSGNSPSFEVVGPPGNVAAIDRAVIARRAYPNGVDPESHWSYDYSATRGVNGSASNGVTEVIARAADNSTVLSRQKHYFLDASRFLTSTGGTGYSSWSTGLQRRSETLNAPGTAVISASEQDWSQRAPVTWTFGYPSEQIQNDNRVNEERSILDTGQTARSTTIYDLFNNPTEKSEFDFDNTLKRRTVTSYSSTNPVNGLNYADDSIRIIRLPLQQSIFDGAGAEQARMGYEYDVYSGADGYHGYLATYSSITGHDTVNYGTGRTTRGNVTRVANWIKTTDSYIYSYPRYDIAGNVVSTKDARGFETFVDFADDFGNGANPGGGIPGTHGPTYAFPTLITSPPPTAGAPVHTARSQYDFSTGLLTGFKDRNGFVTQTIYSDPFNRPTLIKSALGVSGVEAHAAMYYAPAATPFGITLTNNDVLTAKDQTIAGDAVLRSWTKTDGFGRTVEGWSKDPQGDVKVHTIYDALGRTKQVSNPYRPSFETPNYTSTEYDSAGRVTSVMTPDDASVKTAYSGNRVLVADQNTSDDLRRKRISVTDALGRLKEVWEVTAADQYTEDVSFPNWPSVTKGYKTTYQYDTLDNLITVNQRTQARTFAYDSLKRLLSANNPESGTICYGTVANNQCQPDGYDANGNLIYKTDARGVRTSFVYDALNRLTNRSYQNDPSGTPSVTYVYDTLAQNGKGHLTSVSSSVSSYSYGGYDAMGRVTGATQRIGVQTYTITDVAYDLAGHLKTMKYPSGRTITNSYDGAGRLSSFSGTLGGATRTYASDFQYTAWNGLQQEKFGTDTPIYHKQRFNSRGQLWDMRASTVSFATDPANGDRGAIVNYYSNTFVQGGSGADNNGNLLGQDNYIPGGPFFRDSFEYDPLNRLTSVAEKLNGTGNDSFKQSYTYDRWGNRTIDTNPAKTFGAGINNKSFSVNPANNQLTVPLGQTGAMTYDSAGNLTTDTYTGQGSRDYDAENKMTRAWSNNQWQTYVYDGDGRRVRRQVDGIETWQVYGIGGELIAEYAANTAASNPQKEYGYRNGELLIKAEPGASSGAGERSNVALATNGATITVSSELAPYFASFLNDGDRTGNNARVWLDSTYQSWPDWVEINFSGPKTIHELSVVTRQDTDPGVEPSEATTFSLYGSTAYDVQYWTGSAWATVPGGNITANNKVWRKINFAPLTTSKIRVIVNAGQDNVYSRLVEIEAWEATTRPNLALPANGGSVAGSSELSPYVASYLTDGDRTGNNAHAWLDSTYQSWPDWAEVTLGGSQTIGEVVVVTRQDTDPGVDPTEATTFANYGVTAFEVQYWTGSSWVTVPGGTVTGNNKVMRRISFPAVTTQKIRVVSNAGPDNAYTRLVEIEVYAPSGSSSASVTWLVADHLGTPRMVFDQTGSLANVSRHDYLPFGEELFAGTGGRTTALGYTAGDNVRQKFTQKERDNETGLDYFGARYYSSAQGRFTSPDYTDGNPAHLLNSFERSAALPYATLLNPQTINLYTYAYNNPLSYVDPDGHQGGKPEPLPGNRRYTIRPDLNNPNDAPNVHVFDKGGKREIGRVAVKGTTNAPVYEWSGKVPESVKADVEAFLRQKGVQPRPPLHPRGPTRGPGSGGFRARGFAALTLLSILLDAYFQQSSSQQFGYHFNQMGQIVITDLAKTVQNMPQGQLIEFEDTIFTLKGDTFVSIDPDCQDCKLRQDKDGKLYIEGCKQCAEE